MDLLRVSVCFQKPVQQRARPGRRRGPLAGLGVDPREELFEGVICRTDLPQLISDLSEKLFGGTPAIVLDVGHMGRRDVKVRSESAQGEAGTQPKPANLFAEVWWIHVSYVS